MKRILVIGTSGAGKSTLAQRIASSLQLPYIASDHFYWKKDWAIASALEVQQQIKKAIDLDAWVIDGNFDAYRELAWRSADCIIWLDYSIMTISCRIILRNCYWTFSGQTIWSGNRMTLSRAMSGIRHSLTSYHSKRQNYPQWLAELTGTLVYRFSNSRETEKWLHNLS